MGTTTGNQNTMRPRTSTIGSVSQTISKRRSNVVAPDTSNFGDGDTAPARKTSLFDSFRPRSKSDATRKLSHRRVPIVSKQNLP